MKYMGSKNRIAKFILPIMLNEAIKNGVSIWIEPFVGGANLIDKVPGSFKRIGIDINPHVIKALSAIRDKVNELPSHVTEDYYKSLIGKPPDLITSLIRFGASFGGKFEGGFARGKNNLGQPRDYWSETVRNARKQSPNLQEVEFICGSYDKYLGFENCLIYCDPPYEGTTSYEVETFDYPKFWDWCRKMSKNNLVFVSEYKAPDDFIYVWQGECKTNFASQRNSATSIAIEKLFKPKNQS